MKLATLCYIQNQGKTLMMHRIKKANDMHEGKWNGLGGKFEAGESPEDCVKREILEESGLIIESPRLHGFISFPDFDGVDDWYVFVFSADRFTGELIQCEEGHLEWVANEDILKLPLWEGDLIFLKWLYEEPRFFSAKFIYENKVLKQHEVSFYPG